MPSCPPIMLISVLSSDLDCWTSLNVETEQVHPGVAHSLEERVERVALLGVAAPHVPGYTVSHLKNRAMGTQSFLNQHGKRNTDLSQGLVVDILQVLLDSSEHVSSVELNSVGAALQLILR